MSVVDSLTKRKTAKIQQAETLAVLNDDVSFETAQRFVLDTMMPHTVVEKGNVDHLIALLEQMERQPRQILVDISGSAMPLSDMTRLSETCEPDVSVIAVGDRNDIGLFRDLLRMGVTDYLAKPLSADLLRRSWGQGQAVPAPGHRTRTGKVATFVGARGGVGTSTIAANAAWYLSEKASRRVVLVDLDIHGGQAGLLLNAPAQHGLAEVLSNVNQLDPQYMERTLTQVGGRLFLLSAEVGLEEDFPLDAQAVGALLDTLRHHFHYVIIDLPVRGGPVARAVFDRSDTVSVVADSSVCSARETARLVSLAASRDGDGRIAMLLNAPWQPAKGEVRKGDFERAVGRRPSYVLPFDPALAAAENLGEPAAARRGAFAAALEGMVADMMGRGRVAKRSPLGRLLGWRG